MKKVLTVIYKFFRGTFRLLFDLLMLFICWVIKKITYEKGRDGDVTKRKAARIRFLTKVKMFVLNVTPRPINRFFGTEDYRIYLNEHLGNGMQLRYKRAD